MALSVPSTDVRPSPKPQPPLQLTTHRSQPTNLLTSSSLYLQPTTLIAQETSDPYKFRTFTTETAWTLGTALRTRLLSLPPSQRKPALISISLATATASPTNTPHVLFQCATEKGTIPDNENWVRRKRNTVLRWGVSSWAMRMKIAAGLGGAAVGVSAGDIEGAFVRKFALESSSGGAVADEFAIHGGGWPIRVRGVEGVVAVVVVSGLKQEDDHAVVAETIRQVVEEGH
ncbi:uncharacterized protein N7458_002339 [Penicillium daleae]|uniref:DUF967 domain protein n=1 Tax=Penicillium daleae TaxID=63821 RepID=A0AAD6CF13_9EURO|nr:uncharacterized protein N7458_002339 [Penicillium daleae]KAJ5460787.1 hypothetical protein N7458_002339 [Penicillium daleae]